MKKEYIIQSIEMLLDKNHLDDSSSMSILLTMLQRYNDNDAETEVNPLLKRKSMSALSTKSIFFSFSFDKRTLHFGHPVE